MKNNSIRVLLIITAIIGASFSFGYLIDHQMYLPQLTEVGKYARFINHGLFIISLVLLIFSFFMKKKHYKKLGIILIITGLSYFILIFSFVDANLIYLIPLIFYLLSGFIFINGK